MLLAILIAMLALPAFAGEVVSSAFTQRLVFVASGAKEDFAVLDWCMNLAMNRRHHQVRLGMTPDPNICIIDLAALSVDQKDYHELANTWERLALIESNYLGLAVKQKDGTLKRLPSTHPHLGPTVASLIHQHTTNVPIIESRQLLREMLSSADGGLYYKFRGIPGTQKEFLLRFAGASEETVEKMRSDAKAIQKVSGVTSKPRFVYLFHGLGGRATVNTGLVALTGDIKDRNLDPDFDPLRNTVKSKVDAVEAIAELPTGFHAFALFDGSGKLQDSAPDTVVRDNKIPSPWTNRLQGAISCIRCHGPHDGWQPAANDLLSHPKGIFGDGSKAIDQDRVLGLLAEELDQALQLGRDHYMKAAVFLTSQYGLDMDAKGLASRLTDTWASFNYELIDEENAVQEVSAILRTEYPKGTRVADIYQPNPPDESGFIPVDPWIGALLEPRPKDPDDKRNKPPQKITREKWETITPDLIAHIRPEK